MILQGIRVMKILTKYLLLLFLLILNIACFHDTKKSTVKVFKYDGSVQCGSAGIDLDVMVFELINGGVDVLCSQKGHDGLVRATVCGNDTGNINIYKIHKSNLTDAENISFLSVNTLSEYQDTKCP
jgi:hypothetical protein